MNLPEEFKMRRKHLGMLQSEVSEKSGVSKNVVSSFEKGGDIRLSSLLKMLEVLNLRLIIIDK